MFDVKMILRKVLQFDCAHCIVSVSIFALQFWNWSNLQAEVFNFMTITGNFDTYMVLFEMGVASNFFKTVVFILETSGIIENTDSPTRHVGLSKTNKAKRRILVSCLASCHFDLTILFLFLCLTGV